ncbi:chorismate--pyruvate lyase family protein [Kineobactrum salinum]|uniref:Probable chorismate pyruvate-lyase n=1 Tax=Kineobactrum salinum TaxID=2708301 RepID=A0A6C0U0E0_9GAMM|nr:chorismate lyase [Kineobactrum salinum]QIB65572.1 chorismate lyase [Kineobactrum salinum]
MPLYPPATGTRDLDWRPAARFSTASLPPHHRRWLLDDGSLTARLIALQQGVFSVRRLYQGWQLPLPSERQLLELPLRQRVLVREVLLQLDGRPVVFARSLFPVSSLSGSLGHLRKLHNRSLGAILFRHPQMQRSPFELARVAGNSAYLAPAVRQRDSAWGRRSCFDIGGKRLLVSEVFLQHFQPWSAPLPVHRSRRGTVSAAIVPAKQ